MDIEKIYTYTGSFELKIRNKILGTIRYVEDVTHNRKLYRNSDFINALKLHRNFSVNIKPHYRFPGMRHTWSDWVAIKSALGKISNPSEQILEIRSRIKPEEPGVSHSITRIIKDTRIFRFIENLPENQIPEALLTYHECRNHFSKWIKKFGGNPEKFLFEDFEKFSALDFLELLEESGITLKKPETEKIPNANIDLQKIDGKNLQININIQLGK